MSEAPFLLTNEHRKYLGLSLVGSDWDLVKVGSVYLYFDGDVIRKKIVSNENNYKEQELDEKTSDNRSIVLPKTKKGKAKKLNYTATQSFSVSGIYFYFSGNYISIANYTTQTTFFYENLKKENPSIEDFKNWLDKWIKETTETDLIEIEEFRTLKREHQKDKEGDFFTFKIGRRKWGFGRILIDVIKLKKTKEFQERKNLGLASLMGKPLIVKVYHKIADTPNVDIEELSKCMALPPEAMMDNHFYYGEKKIIGHRELKPEEYDELLISYNKRILNDSQTVYLQYGLIYKEVDISKTDKYPEKSFRNEGIGFGLRTDSLEQCISQKSNIPFWNSGYFRDDLRNPQNIEHKREIFRFFELDPDKSYAENLKLFQ